MGHEIDLRIVYVAIGPQYLQRLNCYVESLTGP